MTSAEKEAKNSGDVLQAPHLDKKILDDQVKN